MTDTFSKQTVILGEISYVEHTYGGRYIPEKKFNVPKQTTIGMIADADLN